MKPVGKVLYATGIVAGLVVFFWEDPFIPGGLDYLVLNHIGRTRFQMWTGDVEYTRWLMQVNFFSYVELTTAALPTLEQSRGSLVVVSSVAGKIPTPFTTSYSATKFALDGFFSSLRHELTMQKSNVSITLCILGLIDTEAALENTRALNALEGLNELDQPQLQFLSMGPILITAQACAISLCLIYIMDVPVSTCPRTCPVHGSDHWNFNPWIVIPS
ncbi:hydroxysteroid 11-beta-dehydrogenase 1-like protein [Willisornis vidua]|uniref:Hydroxysteroid 11-beta-dehydrogenase 1-like protein n=1 Tax=Willisornis vidua TaxID=1566151 RepID=A0ABQ9D0F1_9PASS|nr:hydroxysteroid 11-beta-dehydrogenase 1-like protein [Willisornis vidua]